MKFKHNLNGAVEFGQMAIGANGHFVNLFHLPTGQNFQVSSAKFGKNISVFYRIIQNFIKKFINFMKFNKIL